jgi:hypothetical protein
MQGLFEAPSAAPSFSFVMTRSATLSEAGIAREIHEVSAVSTVFYFDELRQLIVVSTSGANANT